MDQSEADEYLGLVKQSCRDGVDDSIEEGVNGCADSVSHPRKGLPVEDHVWRRIAHCDPIIENVEQQLQHDEDGEGVHAQPGEGACDEVDCLRLAANCLGDVVNDDEEQGQHGGRSGKHAEEESERVHFLVGRHDEGTRVDGDEA